ncbi:lysophospholipid acyltransferase family protein [Flavobacterium aquicola]|uniref:KDO2-lipid IV(A) lauroyltransferase n=1 Tax=Flavobacterium aquicola TaxID=1682742 RepID=A0A3E0EMN8_9FLAO|nr:lysophospholipid acyltransferase family protein [Flavobacterium aquicola]REG99448.1 KDO2-lipid IV(A) lauroyltransferase [Flavobacterium aquicola]
MISLFLYSLSLLPLWLLYGISRLCYYFLYYGIRYRRKIVYLNLKKAFYNLSENERHFIEKKFYKNFCDNFIETLKLLSISQKDLQSHIICDYSELEKTLSENKNCHIYLGHQFNWELANAHISSTLSSTVVVAYKPIKNKTINYLMLKLRSRFGSKMVNSKNMKSEIERFSQEQHVLILVADQNPKIPERSFWTSFLRQKTAFLNGPELYTTSNKTTVFFANITKVKRGYYKITISPISDFSKPHILGTITNHFAKKLENVILENPENYLWSHRRWKHEFKEDYKKRWIGNL